MFVMVLAHGQLIRERGTREGWVDLEFFKGGRILTYQELNVPFYVLFSSLNSLKIKLLSLHPYLCYSGRLLLF